MMNNLSCQCCRLPSGKECLKVFCIEIGKFFLSFIKLTLTQNICHIFRDTGNTASLSLSFPTVSIETIIKLDIMFSKKERKESNCECKQPPSWKRNFICSEKLKECPSPRCVKVDHSIFITFFLFVIMPILSTQEKKNVSN